ncbi:MAG: rod shape-determining protein [Clostridia bacterium]|nr:rod shape-determining protein [Clostridia bacterium]
MSKSESVVLLVVGLKIGLDIGTGNVTAAIEGKGVVLCEPAVLALERETGKVLAAGKEALNMTGRCPDAIKLVRPLLSGGISNLENSKLLLRNFIERITKNKIFKPTVAATMPAGLTNLEKRNILECILNAGAGRAVLIEEPLAAALGTGVMLDKPYGTMIVNEGAGTTSVAVITMGSVAVAKSAKIGGSDMDKKIKTHLKTNRGVAVGKLTAEELKIILGGAEIRDESIVAISKGKDMTDGMPMFFEVTAEEIHFAIRECIEEICKAITEVLEVTPPELVNDITDDGIFLCGGVASMYGLDKFIEKQTGIKVKIPGRETEIAALGALRTLVEEDYLSQNGYHFVTLETIGV